MPPRRAVAQAAFFALRAFAIYAQYFIFAIKDAAAPIFADAAMRMSATYCALRALYAARVFVSMLPLSPRHGFALIFSCAARRATLPRAFAAAFAAPPDARYAPRASAECAQIQPLRC